MDSHDVTLGEVWRGMVDMKQSIGELGNKMDSMMTVAEARTSEQVTNVKTEMSLKIAPLESRVKTLERIVWSVVAFVFVAVGGAILALVIHG